MNLGPAPTLSRTVIVSLSLCYLVLNRTSRPVWAWQLGASGGGTGVGDGIGGAAVLIPALEARPFFWRDRGAPKPHRIAFAVEQPAQQQQQSQRATSSTEDQELRDQEQESGAQLMPPASAIEGEGAELVADFLNGITAGGASHPRMAAASRV